MSEPPNKQSLFDTVQGKSHVFWLSANVAIILLSIGIIVVRLFRSKEERREDNKYRSFGFLVILGWSIQLLLIGGMAVELNFRPLLWFSYLLFLPTCVGWFLLRDEVNKYLDKKLMSE